MATAKEEKETLRLALSTVKQSGELILHLMENYEKASAAERQGAS